MSIWIHDISSDGWRRGHPLGRVSIGKKTAVPNSFLPISAPIPLLRDQKTFSNGPRSFSL